MQRPTIKLKLDISRFDEKRFEDTISNCEDAGVVFNSMATLGDTSTQRQQLYNLNKVCSADIPGRGEFFTYEEFCNKRFGKGYDPEGTIVALREGQWIGMTANSYWQKRNFIFNEMTGVLRQYRKQRIALALKINGIRYAKKLNVDYAYTVHDAKNLAAIELNRKIGYIDTDWDNLLE